MLDFYYIIKKFIVIKPECSPSLGFSALCISVYLRLENELLCVMTMDNDI